MDSRNYRSKVLMSLGATNSVKEELLEYNVNRFNHEGLNVPIKLPLADESFVQAWRLYVSEASEKGVFETMKTFLTQTAFPVQEGISQTQEYQAVTRKGILADKVPQATGLILNHPERLQLFLHPTLAGYVPIIISGERGDFISLIRAIVHRNEPVIIPGSMGAIIVSGYNNWDRIHRFKKEWKADNPFDFFDEKWKEEFQRLIKKKELYQDRFIILSNGPYSDIPSKEMGLSDEEWRNLSIIIRREHECTHYFTRRLFSSMQNRLIDELMADFMGIVTGIGEYRTNWFLRFMGLESYPEYRKGGRLENYCGNPPLSNSAFKILQVLVKRASDNLELFVKEKPDKLSSLKTKAATLMSITYLTMEELASDDALLLLNKGYKRAERNIIIKERAID